MFLFGENKQFFCFRNFLSNFSGLKKIQFFKFYFLRQIKYRWKAYIKRYTNLRLVFKNQMNSRCYRTKPCCSEERLGHSSNILSDASGCIFDRLFSCLEIVFKMNTKLITYLSWSFGSLTLTSFKIIFIWGVKAISLFQKCFV